MPLIIIILFCNCSGQLVRHARESMPPTGGRASSPRGPFVVWIPAFAGMTNNGISVFPFQPDDLSSGAGRLSSYEQITYTGTQVLQDGSHTTSSDDLVKLFKAHDWKAEVKNGIPPSPSELAEKIKSGDKLIFLAELDTQGLIPPQDGGKWIPNPTYGQLVPGKPPDYPYKRAAHWVTITDVFQDSGGNAYVEVFNTYSGYNETYTWDTFIGTSQQPGKNEGSFTYVDATK